MTNKYNAVKGKFEIVAYGPCGSMMRTDLQGNVLYCNINQGEAVFKKLLKTAKAEV